MAKTAVLPEVEPAEITTGAEANKAMRRMFALQTQIARAENDLNAEINKLKAAVQPKIDRLQTEFAELDGGVKSYATSIWDKAIHGLKVVFTFGLVKFSNPTGRLVFDGEGKEKDLEAEVIRRIEARGKAFSKGLIRTTKSVEKDALKKLPADVLAELGCMVVVDDPVPTVELDAAKIVAESID